MRAAKGKLVYKIYRAFTYGLSPLLYLHLRWRSFRGIEHPLRWPERLGRPSLPRPPCSLIWFHAASLGEGMVAIPIIKQCIKWRPDMTVLMTTTTATAVEVIKNQLPSGVIYQFAPLDTPSAMDAFLGYWNPNAIVIMESELWPNLIMSASKNGIVLALLNARMSEKSFKRWSGPVLRPLISLMLSKFSLIVPLSTMQAIHFQLLQAPPFIINFCGDLKYAVENLSESKGDLTCLKNLETQLSHRRVWMASSIHRGEEEVMLGVHKALLHIHPDIVTIIVPRYPQHGQEIAQELQKEGQKVALRSQCDKLMPGTNIYVVDTLGGIIATLTIQPPSLFDGCFEIKCPSSFAGGELRNLYRLTPIAVVGGSFFPGSKGHNISEAAAAGCAVLTGHHVGHFSHMVIGMQQVNPLSVLQVSGKSELEEALSMLLSDAKILDAHRMASKQAFHDLSSGIVANVWNLLNYNVLKLSVRM